VAQTTLDSLLEYDWGFPLSAQDIASLRIVAAADSRDGYRLVVDRQATFFYRQIRLTLEPTMTTQQAHEAARAKHLLAGTGLPANHTDIEPVEPPPVSTVFYPYQTLNPIINNLTLYVQGMVKYCSLQRQPSRWLFSPNEVAGEALWKVRDYSPNSFALALDRLDLLHYTAARDEVLTQVLSERQVRKQLTIITVTSPPALLSDWWLFRTITTTGFTWTGWGPQL